MKNIFSGCVSLLLLSYSGHAAAQELYVGAGLPGLYNIGYAHRANSSLSLRLQYANGLNYSQTGEFEGVPATLTLKSVETGLFVDWHPLQGGFRIVAGVTRNDLRAEIESQGSGSATLNGQTISLSGVRYNVSAKFTETTPYLGLGYGHNQIKGWGFYFDLGAKFGRFEVKSDQTLVANRKVTQADVDTQDQKMREAVSSIGYIPIVHLGIGYKF